MYLCVGNRMVIMKQNVLMSCLSARERVQSLQVQLFPVRVLPDRGMSVCL